MTETQEFLGTRIPARWRKVRVSHLVGSDGLFKDGDWIESPYITDRGIRLIQTGNVGIGFYREQGFRYISQQTFDELRCTEVRPGDILICRLADPVGRACLAPDLGAAAITSVDNAILRVSKDNDARYYVYLFSTKPYLDYMAAESRGGTRNRVSRSFLGRLRVPAPDLPTQKQIADFLDRETDRIDQLICKKQRLAKLLPGKRELEIRTKLDQLTNPDARRSLRWLVRSRSGESVPTGQIERQRTDSAPFPVIGGNGVMGFSNRWNVESPVVVIGRVGALCGNVHFVNEKAWITDNALIVTPTSGEMLPSYLFEVLASANLNSLASRSAQPLITGEQVKQQTIALPSVDVQRVVTSEIAEMRHVYDRLGFYIANSVEKLRELRTALITAAVTGQINVETWQQRGETERRIDEAEAEAVRA